MKLSIVATLYESANQIQTFCERMSQAAKDIAGKDDYEIILVNDGSPDNGLEIAINLSHNDPHLVVVDLARNFGHHKAMMTGLSYATGQHIFLIDSDLEEQPEWLVTFFEEMESNTCDVVYGQQAKRKGGFYERLLGGWFWTGLKLLSGMDIPKNTVTARLMSRSYVDALLRHQEREVFITGLWHITGFTQIPQTVNKINLEHSTYTLSKRLALLVNAITSFSNAPLVAIFYFGLIILIFAVFYTAYLIFRWAILDQLVLGWTSVIASIWLLGGLIICFIGIIGIYLSKVYSETKQRPYTIVKAVHGKDMK